MEIEDDRADVVWGAKEIGEVIGRTERQAFHLLESGAIPARKVRGRWAARRSALVAFFNGEVAL